MAINIIQGYAPSTTEPIDSRQTTTNQTSRYAIPSFNAYNGMIVYQNDTQVLWVLIDINNIDNSAGWQQVGSGAGDVGFGGTIGTTTSEILFSVDPTVYSSINIYYNLRFSGGSENRYLSRAGEIIVHIPGDYVTAFYLGSTIIHSTERVVENYASLPKNDKDNIPSFNTEKAIFHFYYNQTTSLIDVMLENKDPDRTLNVRGKYKTLIY